MIEIRDIHKYYTKNKNILSGVNLSIQKGTIQALLGANGAGKSTLINIISCLIKWQQGQILIDNQVITLDDYEYRNKVGYVFENPLYIEKFSAKEYLDFVADMYKINKNDRLQRVKELLEFFELPDDKKYIEDYSKGMKAKVSLAAALIHKPSYLVLDEPFDGMDFVSVQKICKLFRQMATNGATFLVASHQYDVISELGDSFALLKQGKIIFNSSMTELLENAKSNGFTENNSIKAYLESIMATDLADNTPSFLS